MKNISLSSAESVHSVASINSSNISDVMRATGESTLVCHILS